MKMKLKKTLTAVSAAAVGAGAIAVLALAGQGLAFAQTSPWGELPDPTASIGLFAADVQALCATASEPFATNASDPKISVECANKAISVP